MKDAFYITEIAMAKKLIDWFDLEFDLCTGPAYGALPMGPW